MAESQTREEELSSSRLVYRIVRTDPPTERDFLSNAAKGRQPRRPTTEVLRLWDGLSVYDSLEQAAITARLFPHLGRFVAALRLPADDTFRLEQTQDPAVGHFTLWGDPAILLSYVDHIARVHPVH